MARRKHPQEIHFGKKNNLRRTGKDVHNIGETAGKIFNSLRQAKRYMRTGRADRV